MTTQSKFYYPVTVHQEGAQFPDVAPFVVTLPSPQTTDELVAILGMSAGDQAQGVYVCDGTTWKFALPMLDLSASIIRGDALDFYVYPTTDSTAPIASSVYKNGILQSNDNITHGQAVYAVRTPPAGGGGGGAVDSVNGQIGTVLITANNLPLLATVGKTGQYSDLIGAPSPYVLPVATASIIGGVKQGSNITIAGDGTISSTMYTLPTATAGILGGIKVGSGLAVAGDGTLSVSASYTLPQASASVLGGIKVGTSLSIAGDGTLNANLPVAATSSVIGLVKPGTGLTVLGDGTLNASAAVPATTSTLGNVIVGSGINVAGDGTISVAFPVTSVNTKTGAVLITAGNGITVNNAGANVVVSLNLASSDVTTALGYTPYNGTTNPNGYIAANQNITYTGDATGSGTTNVALTLANSGVGSGTYTQVTVDAKGRVTVGANPTTLVGYGITDALNSLTGGSVGGNITLTSGATITGVPTPGNNSDAANKGYVDAAISGVANGTSWRQNAQAASTADLPLTGLSTIDGYAVQAGDRVLVKDQTDQTQNGVYVASAGAWTRATDTDTGAEILGMAILILNGTAAGLSQWINTNTSAITIGTTNITYTQLQAPMSPYTAGTGLSLSANQFSIANTGVVASTYTKVTVNAQGQVTAGAQLASSDVTTALGFTPYNATNPAGYISANQNITVSGDATGSGTTSIALTLANSGVTASTYKSVTVDAKGRVTAGTNPTTLAGFGITDALSNTGGNVSGNITMTSGATVTGVPNPSAGADVSNKTYTDAGDVATFNSVTWKTVVAVTTTANIALTGLQTIDGYAVQAGDRVLVKDQTTQTQNGVYVAAAGAWSRAVDAATGATIKGMIVASLNGTINTLTQWINTNASAITVGTTNITYGQATASGTVYTAGTGLTLSSNQFSITNTGVTANTYTKVTVNAQGQVTAGTALTSGDVTTALGFTPLSSNQTITLSGDMTGSGTTAITATLANTAVTPGSYGDATHISTFTVDSKGRLTTAGTVAISAGVSSVFGQTGAVPNLSGDVTTSGSSATTLAASGVTAGTYTKVTVDAKGRVTVGAAIASSDVTTALGFTPANKAGDTFSGAVNYAPTATVASAATTNIGAAAANDVSITGTTTITAFDTIAAGAVRTLHFAGILTLTNNASIILPSGASITTAAGDTAQFTSKGAGVWTCDYYTKASGTAVVGSPDATKLPLAGGTLSGALNETPAVSLASAATVNIGAAAANSITITGTTTITAFDTIASAAIRRLTFSGVLTLTHNATSLILPTGASITTAAGDIAEFVSLGGGNWRCLYYTKAGSVPASLAGTETLTNKTLSNDTITGFVESGAAATGSSFTPDFTTGTDFEYTTNANTTITLPAAAAGRSYTITIKYGGAHTITFAGGTAIKYPGGTAPVATSVTGKWDVYVCKCDRAATTTIVSDGGRNI